MNASDNAPSKSEVFSESTGDFALVSSDGTIFYISRVVLQLSSKVFETMFEVGTDTSEVRAPIPMQATAKELEMILKITHPSHKNPTVGDAATLVNLLRIAKRYEMDGVLDTLRERLVSTHYVKGVFTEPIAVREPLVALVTSISFGFQDEARLALREVVKCDLGEELEKAQECDIPLSLMHHIYKLRAERVAWYTAKVMSLSQALIKSRELPAVTYSSFDQLPANSAKSEAAVRSLSEGLRWQHDVMQRLGARPIFRAFKELVFKGNGLRVFGEWDISPIVSPLMERWEIEATELESALPDMNTILANEV